MKPPEEKRPISIGLVPIFLLLMLLFFGMVNAQQSAIEVWGDSVVAFPGQQDVLIPVYLANHEDTIAAFELWFTLEQPDIINFEFDNQNMIVTEGTLLEQFNWDYYARSLGGQGTDVHVIADGFEYPDPDNGIECQNGDIPLFKLRADVLNVPDTVSDSIVYIHVIDDMIDNFYFVDVYTNLVGVTTEEIIDTTYFQCTVWEGDICLNWEIIEGPPYDSLLVDTVTYAEKIPGYFEVTNGSLTVLLCGDINVDRAINIIDILEFIDYKFNEGPVPDHIELADVNNDDNTDILDIILLIDFKYNGGPSPACY